MNGKIKFREKLEDKFHYWGFLEDGNFVGPCSPLNHSDQFTGLKDKNGKEIYEGDIVKTCAGEFGIITWTAKIAAFEIVMFSIGRQCVQDNLEIIGNICENPELLK